MTDPVAEAAAQIAAQQAEPTLLEKAMDTIHDLEAKVEHLIHPDAEVPNVAPAVVAGAPEAGAAPVAGGELPNAASVAAESTTAMASAPSACGSGETLSIAASSVKPAHMRIAQHLEAIYTIATEAPAAAVADTSALKTHVGDILHRISNGMQVTEGELVQKLEALYRML